MTPSARLVPLLTAAIHDDPDLVRELINADDEPDVTLWMLVGWTSAVLGGLVDDLPTQWADWLADIAS